MPIIPDSSKEFFEPYLGRHIASYLTLLVKQIEELYDRRNILVPAAMSSTFHYLGANEGASLADIAKPLGYTHQLTTQHVAKLIKLDLVCKKPDETDQRRQKLFLTVLGKTQYNLLSKTMQEASDVYDAYYEEIGFDIRELMQSASSALNKISISDRFSQE